VITIARSVGDVQGVINTGVLKLSLIRSRVLTNFDDSQCVYHPAPLTRPKISPRATADNALTQSSVSPRTSPFTAPARASREVISISPTENQESSSSIMDGSTGKSAPPVDSFLPSPILPMASMAAHGRQMSSSTPQTWSSSSAYSRKNRTGFLGPTAYSAVYTENSSKLTFCRCWQSSLPEFQMRSG